MEGRVLSHGDKTATKETITDCEIVYNPVLSCVKLAKLCNAGEHYSHSENGTPQSWRNRESLTEGAYVVMSILLGRLEKKDLVSILG